MKTEEIVEWYSRDRRAAVSGHIAQELYFQFHPRTAFLKMLPVDARVADIGAGDGSLSVFRTWPDPARKDLRLHAYSLEKGEHFDRFESYEISDWNASPPEFGGLQFDGIVCAHFIEHVSDPASFAAWAGRKLVRGGRAYVEWPSEASVDLPSRDELLQQGVPLIISRYHDDSTHSSLPARDLMIEAFEANGLQIEQQGVVSLPWVEEQLMANFKDSHDSFPRQAAFWSMTRWSQFLIVRRA
ncbi:MAG: methyltransferase domain-containing protein [Pseudoxanthomonas sp.]